MMALVEIRNGDGSVLFMQQQIPEQGSAMIDIPPIDRWHKVVISIAGQPPEDLSARVAELEAQLEAVRALVCECALPEED